MKHDKYDYSGYCCDESEPVNSREKLFFWSVIAAGVGAWSTAFFLLGYYFGAG